MKQNYLLINCKSLEEKHIDKVNLLLMENQNKLVIVNIPNTKDLEVNLLDRIIDRQRFFLRIEGGYDKRRLKHDIGNDEIHIYSNLYTIPQVKMIMHEINNILKRIHTNWTKEQILVYFLNELSTKIIYNNQYRYADEYDIRNLTGLYSTKSVCSGYSLILKELCDQVGIECMYVEGFKGKGRNAFNRINHAWNIVKLNDKYYPIDITNDLTYILYCTNMKAINSFNKESFLKKYIPGENEIITNYQLLSSLNDKIIKRLFKQTSLSREYMGPILLLKRKDNTSCLITQCGDITVEGIKLIKYVISSTEEDLNPQVVYTTFDLDVFTSLYEEKEELIKEKLICSMHRYTDKVNSNKMKLEEMDKTINMHNLMFISNILFSEFNIEKSDKRNNFLGSPIIKYNKAIGLSYDPNITNNIKCSSRTYTRSDGSKFLVEKIKDYQPNLYCYKIYEYIHYLNGYKLLENIVYTDYDILTDDNLFLADTFLSRERIDNNCLNNNGYLGHYTNNYLFTYNKNVRDKLDRLSKVSIATKRKVLVKNN